MKLKPFVLMLSATAAGLLSACTPSDSGGNAAANIAEAKASARDWPTFSHAFLENYFKLNPSFAVYQGRHEFGGQLPDWRSEEHTSELQSLMRISYAVFCLKKTTLT